MVTGMHLTALGDGVVLLEPGEGLDPGSPDAYLGAVLERLQHHRAHRLIYDLEKAAIIDGLYYGWLKHLARTCRVAGVDLVVANMRPEAAFALAMNLDETPPFACARDVDRARALQHRSEENQDGSPARTGASRGVAAW